MGADSKEVSDSAKKTDGETGLKSKKAAESNSKAEAKSASKKEAAAATSKMVATAAASAAKPAATKPPAAKASEGLADDALTQIAQAKFEAQEERLKDVARQSMALLRDFQKLDASDCTRKIADIQKSLLKYEMQFIRAWEFQEHRRNIEIEALEAQTRRYREEAEEEGAKISDLRQVLETESRRRKRYEGYEEAAAEINKKKTRKESTAEIQAAIEEIAKLQMQQQELEALTEERNKRAQQLRHAVEELKTDLQKEQQLRKEVLGQEEVAAAASAAAGASEKAASGTDVPPDLVEVIS
mmetsp:Transcript_87369/g.154917  ORF Transcript_87369/g.154917 Transcript_87369/m.154917 type:complete len:299 (+) Transcript_87369:81-977(+)